MEMNEKGEILINPNNYQGTRYNGGWMKTITKINKEKTDGYSLIGEFINGPIWIKPHSLLLDCGIGGSRKNQEKFYKLFTVDENGNEIKIADIDEGRDWAIKCWSFIEEYLASRLESKCGCGKIAHFAILVSGTDWGFICEKCLENNIKNLILEISEIKRIK